MNELLKNGRLEPLEQDETEYNMSLTGSLYACGSKSGYGALKFKHGEIGAGISVRTVHGDGVYQVFAEKHKGEIVRVYVDLQ